ncbi:DUF3880 domain-containing protein [Paenibacillus sp. CC-CFT747]|nr:DUF3880 domain-containing protein [Paenibacillus sp. CC-CFT747]
MGRSKEGSRQARRAARAHELGLRLGRQAGEEMGRRLARLEAVIGQITAPAVIRSDWRVLYVTSGMEEPYSSLDSAAIDALGGMVRELGVIAPSRETAAEAVRFEPDLVLVLSGIKLPVKQAALMRSLGLRTAVWFTDDPYYTDWTVRIAPHYRHVFTQELGCVPFYRGLGCEDVRYLPLGMNPKTFHPRRSGARHHTDVCFIGNAFANRITLFRTLAPRLAGRRWLISGLWWRRMKGYRKYRDHLRTDGWLSPGETALYYSGARMVINQHRAFNEKRLISIG